MLLRRTGERRKTSLDEPRTTAEGRTNVIRDSVKIVERLKRSSASGTRRNIDARWRDSTSSRRESRERTNKNSAIRERRRINTAKLRRSMESASRTRPRVSKSTARSL